MKYDEKCLWANRREEERREKKDDLKGVMKMSGHSRKGSGFSMRMESHVSLLFILWKKCANFVRFHPSLFPEE